MDFIPRHIGPDDREIKEMLGVVGCGSLDELIEETIPPGIRFPGTLQIPEALSEYGMTKTLKSMASQNQIFRSYLGYGFHQTITPAPIQRHVIENPGWYTQYTPYQPEISQGRLECLFHFQTMVSDLTGLPVANASLLDEPTAAAEAMAMAYQIKKPDLKKALFFLDPWAHPATKEVILGRARFLDLEITQDEKKAPGCFAGLFAYPDTLGRVPDMEPRIQNIKSQGGLVILSCDLLALTLLKSPGELGCDIALGSTQRFGVPLGFGGPHAAFLTTKDDYKRLVPGRVVGLSKDKNGAPAYRLALQTREQHIRREKATSNICTAQALLANVSALYGIYHGPQGLIGIAERIRGQASRLARGIREAHGRVLSGEFFDTLWVEAPGDILGKALTKKINLRKGPEKGQFVIALDETVEDSDLLDLLEIFGHPKPTTLLGVPVDPLPQAFTRQGPFLTQAPFHRYRSESKLLRYIKSLEAKDLSLTRGMIPLGSCTMKLNSASELMPISWPQWADIHPFAPRDQTLGYGALFQELSQILCEITGFDRVSLQPNSGAQGEFAGLCTVAAYLKSRGEKRRICLIPSSAHGTNPASAAMAGFQVVVVSCDTEGNVDLKDLAQKIDQHKDNLALLMLTYPSTHGVFEEGVREICQMVHGAGGQVYMDGANMNAQVGLCRPGDYGPDLCHLNLHKTFCIPHGGGGPGMGPIGVKSHLAPFMPGALWLGEGQEPAVSGSPQGSAGILPISWAYCRMMGPGGLKRATQVAILNANYCAKRLSPYYPLLYQGKKGRVAHECLIDLRPLKALAGVEVVDVAKRLMDYGFHAPTMSFPVAGTLMIEPTESEDKGEIDRFCDAMIAIHGEIQKIAQGAWPRDNNPLKNAPHTLGEVSLEVWDRPYRRGEAFFPSKDENKFWPSVARIDEAYGDRNFICSCPPEA